MVNYLTILVATIIGYIIGALWYSPLLFGNLWVKLMKFSKIDMEKSKKQGMAKQWITMFIATLILTYILSQFIVAGAGWLHGLRIGALVWLGFLATTQIGIVLWEKKPFALYAINTLHYLVVLVVMGSILGAWG
jgi:hypothetical protein